MLRKEKIAQLLMEWTNENPDISGFSAQEIAEELSIARNTVSYELNRLVEDEAASKLAGKPVLFRAINFQSSQEKIEEPQKGFFEKRIGGASSLSKQIEQAKAAVLYPPKGLHTLILGASGVGKTFFAKIMHEYAINREVIAQDAPLVVLNCADYAENQQLLVSQLFGYVKGSFTGAVENRDGLVKKAENGYLFLDEVHNLSSEGQEILFTLMDKGTYRRFGESETVQKSNVRIVCATTSNQKNYLLQTFLRRIPITIELPTLDKRSLKDRYSLVRRFIQEETLQVQKRVCVTDEVLNQLLFTEFKGNIGELRETIKLLCAKAFVDSLEEGVTTLTLSLPYLDALKGFCLNKDILNIHLGLQSRYVNAGFVVEPSDISEVSFSDSDNNDFYDDLHDKFIAYSLTEKDSDALDQKINLEVEHYFSNLLAESRRGLELKVDLSKLVPRKLLDETELFIEKAQRILHKQLKQDAILGLALHTKAFIERSSQNKQVYNPNKEKIRLKYSREYSLSTEYLERICEIYELPFSEDEVAFVTMFLLTKNIKQVKKKYQIILLCHGSQTASSMADTANQLLAETWIDAIDMPLDISVKAIQSQVLNMIELNQPSKGVLLMVDMGSLTTLCSDIWNHYEGRLAIGMISGFNMLLLLEASRKLMFLEEQIDEMIETIDFDKAITTMYVPQKKEMQPNIIWTCCMTGVGTASKIKKIIEGVLIKLNCTDVTVTAIDYHSLEENFHCSKEKPKVIVGVTTENCCIGVPMVSLTELINGQGLLNILDEMDIAYKQSDVQDIWGEAAKVISLETILDTLQTIEPNKVVKMVGAAIEEICEALHTSFSLEIWTRLLIHISFAIERMMVSKMTLSYTGLEKFYQANKNVFQLVKEKLASIENFYNIVLPMPEIAYIVELLQEDK